jgi:hypothetical protein
LTTAFRCESKSTLGQKADQARHRQAAVLLLAPQEQLATVPVFSRRDADTRFDVKTIPPDEADAQRGDKRLSRWPGRGLARRSALSSAVPATIVVVLNRK